LQTDWQQKILLSFAFSRIAGDYPFK